MDIRLLKANEIECRIGTFKENKGISLLLYKDARVDMRILDEVFGFDGWEREHHLIDGKLFCTVKVWSEKRGCWISKHECISTRDNLLALFLSIGNNAGKDAETCVDSCVKSLLLKGHNLENVIILSLKLWICILVLCDNDFAKATKEHTVNAEPRIWSMVCLFSPACNSVVCGADLSGQS